MARFSVSLAKIVMSLVLSFLERIGLTLFLKLALTSDLITLFTLTVTGSVQSITLTHSIPSIVLLNLPHYELNGILTLTAIVHSVGTLPM